MRFAVILFGICAVIGRTYSQECGGNEFTCAESGVCIPENRVCDGIVDCLGGSDEVNCPPTTTTECPGFVCPDNGRCIPGAWICDGWVDCEDNSDEQGCETTSTTPCSGFVCASGRCINENFICDGDDDCDDCSDELDCGPCEGFQCPCGKCILDWRVCDGRNDCWDYADESEENCPCADNEYRCSRLPDSDVPGICIPQEFVCDEEGIWDCPNGADEANCTRSGDIDIDNLTVNRYRPETVKASKIRGMVQAEEMRMEMQKLEMKRRLGKSN